MSFPSRFDTAPGRSLRNLAHELPQEWAHMSPWDTLYSCRWRYFHDNGNMYRQDTIGNHCGWCCQMYLHISPHNSHYSCLRYSELCSGYISPLHTRRTQRTRPRPNTSLQGIRCTSHPKSRFRPWKTFLFDRECRSQSRQPQMCSRTCPRGTPRSRSRHSRLARLNTCPPSSLGSRSTRLPRSSPNTCPPHRVGTCQRQSHQLCSSTCPWRSLRTRCPPWPPRPRNIYPRHNLRNPPRRLPL